MNRRVEVAAILADVLPRLEALRADAVEEIDRAKERAAARVARHQAAGEELASVEGRIASLEAERDALPAQVTRASLDEDFLLEDELKERYRSVKPQLQALEERREALRSELKRLVGLDHGHALDATISAYGEAAGVAHGCRSELEGLRDALVGALEKTCEPAVRGHEQLRGTVSQLGHDRSWEMSPVGQGAIRV